jgi:polysaccharide chain length determinant protein (PEP-CTERM system associated)
MINTGKLFDISGFIVIILRRVWYIVIPFVIVMTAAVLYVLFAPKVYLATTTILVTPQKVPVDFVRPTITARIEDRLQSIAQEILSRTRLEQVIAEFHLYSREAKTLTREEIVEQMRRDVWVKIRGNEGYFTITYSGEDPKTVTLVTNKLASLFIEENLKYREVLAQGTTEFLGVELKATKTKLEEQEKAITNFKMQFMNELPEQRNSNLAVLQELQRDHQRISESLRSAQDRKIVIQKQLTEMKQMQMMASLPKMEISGEEGVLPANPSTSGETSAPAQSKGRMKDPNLEELDHLRRSLRDLQAKYTGKHPDIQVTKKKIAEMEKTVAAAMQEGEKAKTGEIEEKGVSSVAMKVSPSRPPERTNSEKKNESDNLFYKEIEGQKAAADLEIERLKREDSNTRVKIAGYQRRIENAPLRELSMVALNRDYFNTKESYESLLKKNSEAQQAENLERRQKGEQFKVIDPARLPEKPHKPQIPQVLLFGLLLGAGAGLGMAFLKEQMDHTFRDAGDLESTLEIKVLANIPQIASKAA